MSQVRPRFVLARAVLREARARDIQTLAAGIAYYAFVSVVPLLALSVVVAATVGGEALEAAVTDLASRFLLPAGREPVTAALRGTQGRGSTTLIGVATLAWSSLRLFRGVDGAFSRVYGTAPGGILDRIRDGFVVLLGVGVGTLSVSVVGGALGRFGAPAALVAPLSLLVLAVGFFPFYYVFPDADVTPREVLPGTAFAAGGWTLLGIAFGAYAAYARTEGQVAVYGVLGGLVLLVTWFYFAGLVLLLGAVLNAVRADRIAGDRQVQLPSGRHDGRMSEEADADAGGDADAEGEADARDAAGEAGGVDHAPDAGRDGTGGAVPGEGPTGGEDGDGDDAPDSDDADRTRVAELERQVAALRDDLGDFRADVDERTLHRDEVESDLKRYVRRRIRRGHARGWGPYLVLLYGTVMTLGAFYFLRGGWAILAMVVLFLSTLGLYTLFVLVGVGLNLLGTPRRVYERVREFRE